MPEASQTAMGKLIQELNRERIERRQGGIVAGRWCWVDAYTARSLEGRVAARPTREPAKARRYAPLTPAAMLSHAALGTDL